MNKLKVCFNTAILLTLTACEKTPDAPQVDAPQVDTNTGLVSTVLSVENDNNQNRLFSFEWNDVDNANSYQLCLRDDSLLNDCMLIEDVLDTDSTDYYKVQYQADSLLTINDDTYFVIAKNEDESALSNEVQIEYSEIMSASAYVKASDADARYEFGSSVTMNHDGTLLAVGSPLRKVGSAVFGAVYLFERNDNDVSELEIIVADDAVISDNFGQQVALNKPGNILLVSATNKDVQKGGETLSQAGAVYVFINNNGMWQQHQILTGSGTIARDNFGSSLVVSDDGNTVAIGIESGSAAISNPDDVYIFERDGEYWVERQRIEKGYLRSDGINLDISGDGYTVAIGDHKAKGVHLYQKNNDEWNYTSLLQTNDTTLARTGLDVSLDQNGTTLAVSSANEKSVYVFEKIEDSWNSQLYTQLELITDNKTLYITELSQDGNTLAIGDYLAKYDNLLVGNVLIYKKYNDEWIKQQTLTASNQIDNSDKFNGVRFGSSLSFTTDAKTLVIGSPKEKNVEDEQGNIKDGSQEGSGAIYVY